MANRITPPPFSATDPPPSSRWWSLQQLRSLYRRRKELSHEEQSAIDDEPLSCAMFTLFAIMGIILFYVMLPCHVSFSVESISGSPSSAKWQVDFLMKKSCSWCPVYYDGSDVYVKLGYLNAAVLKTSPTHGSLGRYTRFSVDLATEDNQNNVVATSHRVFELNMKLGAKKHILSDDFYGDGYGYFDIKCQNLTLDSLNVKCHSSFKSSAISE